MSILACKAFDMKSRNCRFLVTLETEREARVDAIHLNPEAPSGLSGRYLLRESPNARRWYDKIQSARKALGILQTHDGGKRRDGFEP